MKCKYCGKEVLEGSNFCSNCGEAQNEIARKVLQKWQSMAQLKLIYLLIEKVKDKQTLEILQKLLEKYKQDN